MSVKIRVDYQEMRELENVVGRFDGFINKVKLYPGKSPYRRAVLYMKNMDKKAENP